MTTHDSADGHAPHSQVTNPARWAALASEQDALAIKHSTERTGALVERYRVSRTTVKQIRNGSIWRHIP